MHAEFLNRSPRKDPSDERPEDDYRKGIPEEISRLAKRHAIEGMEWIGRIAAPDVEKRIRRVFEPLQWIAQRWLLAFECLIFETIDPLIWVQRPRDHGRGRVFGDKPPGRCRVRFGFKEDSRDAHESLGDKQCYGTQS